MASTKRSCSSSDQICRCLDTTYGLRGFPSAEPVIFQQRGPPSASLRQCALLAHRRAAIADRRRGQATLALAIDYCAEQCRRGEIAGTVRFKSS